MSGKPLSSGQRKSRERLAKDGQAGGNQELQHCARDGREELTRGFAAIRRMAAPANAWPRMARLGVIKPCRVGKLFMPTRSEGIHGGHKRHAHPTKLPRHARGKPKPFVRWTKEVRRTPGQGSPGRGSKRIPTSRQGWQIRPRLSQKLPDALKRNLTSYIRFALKRAPKV